MDHMTTSCSRKGDGPYTAIEVVHPTQSMDHPRFLRFERLSFFSLPLSSIRIGWALGKICIYNNTTKHLLFFHNNTRVSTGTHNRVFGSVLDDPFFTHFIWGKGLR